MDGLRSSRHQFQPRPKFTVNRNPAFSAALTSNSLPPTESVFLFGLGIAFVSVVALAIITARSDDLIYCLELLWLPVIYAQLIVKALQTSVGLALIASLIALTRMISAKNINNLGRSCKMMTQSNCWTPSSKPMSVPAQKPTNSYKPIDQMWFRPNLSPEKIMLSPSSRASTPDSQIWFSPSLRLSPEKKLLSPSRTSSPGSSWTRLSPPRKFETREDLETFLAEAEQKMVSRAEAAAETTTPPRTLRGIRSRSLFQTSETTLVASTSPLRHVTGTYRKKMGFGPSSPMSTEEMIQGYKRLGIYPQIEQWRDGLRQWFSSDLLQPLAQKIEQSHKQVMDAAAKVGITINVPQVGNYILTTPNSFHVSGFVNGFMEWPATIKLDEDQHLEQLRVHLEKTIHGAVSQAPQVGVLYSCTNLCVPLMQNCINTIKEHQMLNHLMKGNFVKGLLPIVDSSHAVERVRELAKGTCLKNYEYAGNVGNLDYKRYIDHNSFDTHLLAYIFCSHLNHPMWMLETNSNQYSSHSIKDPLFLGHLPPKDGFLGKYVAMLSETPSYIHAEACILVIGKQNPPIFNLYWDSKLQFSLQGRTSLWDSLLLFCHRIKVDFGGVVRGIHMDI